MDQKSTESRTLRLVRTIDAPVKRVWEAWSNADQVAEWWSPSGFTTTIHTMDLMVGGEWRLTIHGPDGKNYPNRSIFREIVPHRKFVYEHFNPDFLGVVDFQPQGEKTVVDWSMVFPTVDLFEVVVKTFKADEGQKQNVDKLEKFLAEWQS